jgi:hypothetical protein
LAKKDTRLFIRLDLDYPDHPKIIGLSDAAFRAHVTMMAYARKHKTDGRIPQQIAQRFVDEALNELRTNDPETPSLELQPDGSYFLHGYADMNETRAEIDARSRANAENGRRSAAARKQTVQRKRNESLNQSFNEIATETETEIEIEEGGGYVVQPVAPSAAEAADHEPLFIDVELPLEEPDAPDTGKYPADFTAFWDIYPRRNGKGAACAAFIKAKKRATVTEIIDGATRLRDDPNLPTDRSLIPMPSTWLNQDRWEDDPLPMRMQDMSSSQRRLAHAYQEAQVMPAPTNPDDAFTQYLDAQPRKELT